MPDEKVLRALRYGWAASLPDLLAKGGFADVRTTGRVDTFLGMIALLKALKPGIGRTR